MVDVTLNGIITLTRGDSATIPLSITDGDRLEKEPTKYILKDDDTVYFGMMRPNQPFKDAVIRKTYKKEDLDENDDIPITFRPEDTENLPSGMYYYEIKLRKGNVEETCEVSTIVEKTIFYLID